MNTFQRKQSFVISNFRWRCQIPRTNKILLWKTWICIWWTHHIKTSFSCEISRGSGKFKCSRSVVVEQWCSKQFRACCGFPWLTRTYQSNENYDSEYVWFREITFINEFRPMQIICPASMYQRFSQNFRYTFQDSKNLTPNPAMGHFEWTSPKV